MRRAPGAKIRVGSFLPSPNRLEQLVKPPGAWVKTANSQGRRACRPSKNSRQCAARSWLLVDAEDMIFATIGDGLISIITRDSGRYIETTRTLDGTRKDNSGFRIRSGGPHRSFLVNLHPHQGSGCRGFKSTFMLKMNDIKNKPRCRFQPPAKTRTGHARNSLNMVGLFLWRDLKKLRRPSSDSTSLPLELSKKTRVGMF